MSQGSDVPSARTGPRPHSPTSGSAGDVLQGQKLAPRRTSGSQLRVLLAAWRLSTESPKSLALSPPLLPPLAAIGGHVPAASPREPRAAASGHVTGRRWWGEGWPATA